ncbi:MAG: aldose 1-epimerase family protein [Candidatus Bathyarchaeia archaeon]|nr:aldose 1-epimerase family protein [Candidatus Bathyarchaeota archaeon]
MVRLFGVDYDRRELYRRVGDLSQLGGVKYYELRDGNQKGVEALDFGTGSGLRFTVLPGRGMDISHAEYKGIPLCWRSPTGDVAPCFYEPEGLGWLRSFYGGLLVTCGLTNAGAPSEDEGLALGLHGRISNIPARGVAFGDRWKGDECILWARGIVREASVFGENLSLERLIEARLGGKSIHITDKVENLSFSKTPHMILYHVNIGFPVVDRGSMLIAPVLDVKPRDKEAEEGAEEYNRFSDPIPGFKEKVYYLAMKGDRDGYVYAAIVNREFMDGEGIGVYVKYKRSQLDYFVEWKMMGEGVYVVGMEPANCKVEGRAKMREEGTLKFLDPGEARIYELEIGVLASNSEIASMERLINGILEES